LVLRIVAMVQASRVGGAYGACIGRRDALSVQSTGRREPLPVQSMAQDQPTFSVFSDVEPGE